MVEDGVDRERTPTAGASDPRSFAGNEQAQTLGGHILRQLHFDVKRTDWYQFVHRLTPATSAREVYQVQDEATILTVQVTVD